MAALSAFDVTHAHAPDSQWTAKHLMSINGRFEQITFDDLDAVGERNDVPGYRRIVREVLDATNSWPDLPPRPSSTRPPSPPSATTSRAFRPRWPLGACGLGVQLGDRPSQLVR